MGKLLPILGLFIFAGCSGGQSSTANRNPNAINTSNLNSNTCQITRPGGTLAGGFDGSTVQLNPYYLDKANQTIYGEGEFPNPYTMGFEDKAPARKDLLANAVAWHWSISPKKDSEGNWSLLEVYKEVLYADNDVYVIDAETINYGQSFRVNDQDGNITIECVIGLRD